MHTDPLSTRMVLVEIQHNALQMRPNIIPKDTSLARVKEISLRKEAVENQE